MISPLKNYIVTQEYGEFTTDAKGHTGIDLAAPIGTLVYAVADGTVIAAGIVKNSYGNEAYGNCVLISHQNSDYSFYAHMNSVSVRAGQKVVAGQEIGTVGNTGNTTGPHLHFEIRISPSWNRKNFRNPREYISFDKDDSYVRPVMPKADESIKKGAKARISANIVNLRDKAGIGSSRIIGELHLGAPVEVDGEGVKMGGLTWFPVTIKGYVAETDGYTRLISKE